MTIGNEMKNGNKILLQFETIQGTAKNNDERHSPALCKPATEQHTAQTTDLPVKIVHLDLDFPGEYPNPSGSRTGGSDSVEVDVIGKIRVVADQLFEGTNAYLS